MTNSFLNNVGLTLLRIAPSAIMLFVHGLPKLQKLLAGNFSFANPIGIGETPSLFLTVIGEFFAPLLIILGYKTRFAVVPVAIVMLVAAFAVHGDDSFVKKELALLYFLFFILIGILGPGKYSIDKK